MSHTHLHSVIDVECVSNTSKDIISFIIKGRWFLLNNKIFTFHDIFTFTDSTRGGKECENEGCELCGCRWTEVGLAWERCFN